MKLLRRVLVTASITLAVILAVIYWVAPIALSLYAGRKVPPVARVGPTELKDHSISQASGLKLSYVGYDFEVPWTDLDEPSVQLFPKDKPHKTMAILPFRSGLRLTVTSSGTPRTFADEFARDFKVPRKPSTLSLGRELQLPTTCSKRACSSLHRKRCITGLFRPACTIANKRDL